MAQNISADQTISQAIIAYIFACRLISIIVTNKITTESGLRMFDYNNKNVLT
jgi:hypothetical protein